MPNQSSQRQKSILLMARAQLSPTTFAFDRLMIVFLHHHHHPKKNTALLLPRVRSCTLNSLRRFTLNPNLLLYWHLISQRTYGVDEDD